MQKGFFKSNILRKIPAFLWGFLILYLTLKPNQGSDHEFPIWLISIKPDKIAHFTFWASWYWIYHISFRQKNEARVTQPIKPVYLRTDFLVACWMVIFGALVEFLQWYTDWGRGVEAMDFVADTLGVFLAFWFLNRKK
jgi:hypothetical protein